MYNLLADAVLDFEFFNPDFYKILFRYSVNIIVAFAVIYFTYYRHNRQSEYTFVFFVFNTMVFMICYMLASVKLGIGIAFGLFAIFSVLRYRTNPIPIKEMTYLLVVISVAVINAVSGDTVSVVELSFVNIIVIAITFLVEWVWHKNQMLKVEINYKSENIIHVKDYPKIKDDLIKSTGLNIQWFEVKEMNISKGTSTITVYYKERQ